MHYITTNDNTRLYIKDWGTGIPVILIHGWPLSSDSWDALAIDIVDAGYRVISYDRRGFGRSSQPWSGYDYDTLADDLAEVIKYAAAQETVLVGFSMGGGEVARYMSRHAGRTVIKTVLISSILPYRLQTDDNPDGTPQADFDKTIKALNTDRAEFYDDFFKNFFGVSLLSQTVSTELLEWMRSIAMQASLKATLACQKAFSSTDFRSELVAFTVPTLIIHGSEDKTVPIKASSRITATHIAQSKLIEYDGAPHGLFVTEKDRLTTDILNFLNH